MSKSVSDWEVGKAVGMMSLFQLLLGTLNAFLMHRDAINEIRCDYIAFNIMSILLKCLRPSLPGNKACFQITKMQLSIYLYCGV